MEGKLSEEYLGKVSGEFQRGNECPEALSMGHLGE